MKKLFLIVLLSSYFTFAQEDMHKSYFEFKNEIKNSSDKSIPQLSFNNSTDLPRKNTGLAIIYSLLLPGMGELYAESYESGKYFTVAEAVLWGSYIGINTYANWQKNRYKSFAAANGAVELEGKDDDYFAIIGEYLSVEHYNNEKALERNFSEMLNANKYYWNWTSENRKTYRSMWVSSEQSFNNLRFVIGALIVNRIASAINAVRLVSKFNRQQSEELSWFISAGVENSLNLPNHFIINFQTRF